MKVGLSFSRCLRDIVEARVGFDDVLVIIARTDFDPHSDAHWKNIWDGYRFGGLSNPEWADAEPNLTEEDACDAYRNVAIQLYDHGKIHQPRQYPHAHTPRMPYYWLDCSVPKGERSPAAHKAWEQYQIISGLSKKQRVLKDDF